MAKRSNRNAVIPLPSLLHASAWDTANQQMRDAGRAKWNEEDASLACETQNRLVRQCYTLPGDSDPRLCFIRAQMAARAEKAGLLTLYTDWPQALAAIEKSRREWEAGTMEAAA